MLNPSKQITRSAPVAANRYDKTAWREKATGYQTTTVETGDKQLAKHFIGEFDHPHSGRSIAVKTHWFGYIKQWYRSKNSWKRRNKKLNNHKLETYDTYRDARNCIFLLREPIRAFTADFQKKQTGGNHVGYLDLLSASDEVRSKFINASFSWITDPKIGYFDIFINAVNKSCRDGWISVLYENLLQNCTSEMKKIVGFLNIAWTRVSYWKL